MTVFFIDNLTVILQYSYSS